MEPAPSHLVRSHRPDEFRPNPNYFDPVGQPPDHHMYYSRSDQRSYYLDNRHTPNPSHHYQVPNQFSDQVTTPIPDHHFNPHSFRDSHELTPFIGYNQNEYHNEPTALGLGLQPINRVQQNELSSSLNSNLTNNLHSNIHNNLHSNVHNNLHSNVNHSLHSMPQHSGPANLHLNTNYSNNLNSNLNGSLNSNLSGSLNSNINGGLNSNLNSNLNPHSNPPLHGSLDLQPYSPFPMFESPLVGFPSEQSTPARFGSMFPSPWQDNEGFDSGTGMDETSCQWENCHEVFMGMDELIKHVVDVHIGSGRSMYECRWHGCKRDTRPFPKRHKMLNHFRTHTGEKPYLCRYPTCKKSFSRPDSLATHIKTHSDIRPFACIIPNCGRAYYHSRSLRKHLLAHAAKPSHYSDLINQALEATRPVKSKDTAQRV